MRKILNLITVAFIVLKFRGDDPFIAWSWLTVLSPFIIAKILDAIKWIWEQVGAGNKLRGELALLRYEILLKRAVNSAKKDLQNAKKD